MKKEHMKDQWAVDAYNVSFSYGKKRKAALNNISLRVRRGEIFGLLGPNGSGKTTFMGILSTLLPFFKGELHMMGIDLKKEPAQVRQSISVLFEDVILDEELTGRVNLLFFAKVHGLKNRETAEKRVVELAAELGIESRLDDQVKLYSKGMKRRLELIRCLLAKPSILLFDEPTAGLDPLIRNRIWRAIKRLNEEEGTTILIATHSPEEAEAICDRAALLRRGELIEVGLPGSVMKKFLRFDEAD